jgi:hypothetical protein
MGSIQTIIASLCGAATIRADGTRTRERRVPACDLLEGRALLNASWGMGQSHGMWDGTAGGSGHPDPAHVRPWDGATAFDKGHLHNHGFSGQGNPGRGMGALSTQAQADLQTLQNDVKTLQSEIPTTLQDQLKADKAIIDQALGSLTPAQRRAEHQAHALDKTTPPSDPITGLTDRLKTANVSADKITQITTDFQTYQSTLQTVDPTLYTKVQADQAALSKDLPAGHHPGPQGGAGLLGPGLLGPGF